MGKFLKKSPKGRKKLVLILGALATAGALGAGGFFLLRGSGEAVKVYPFAYIGMTEYWGDSQESYGPVSTDKIQTIFLSDTQTVTEVKVKEGDEVKKGDLLLTFDTTLSELQLERKRLAWEKEKLELTRAKNRLEEIRNMRPYEPQSYNPPAAPAPDLGRLLLGDFEVLPDAEKTHDGLTEEKAIVLWVAGNRQLLTNAQMLEVQQVLQDIRTPKPTPGTPGDSDNQGGTGDGTQTDPDHSGDSSGETNSGTQTGDTDDGAQAGGGSTGAETGGENAGSPEGQGENLQLPEEGAGADQENLPPSSPSQIPEGGSPDPDDTPGTTPAPLPQQFYVVFQVTKDNKLWEEKLIWMGAKITVEQQEPFSFSLEYYTPSMDDYTQKPPEEMAPVPEPDFGSGYTEAELAKMKKDQLKAIAEQDFKVRMAETEYKIMKAELNDGNIYALIDGTVVSLLEEEEAKATQQPFMKVSGGGGFLVQGSVSELEKDAMAPGQEVTINDWNTGATYTGTVREVGDFPTGGNGWNGMGNPNATYYPFIVFVGEEADLRAGSYVSIQYSSADSTHGIYLENPFIRTEGGKSYVLARGDNGRTEKRYITVGKSLWGSYTEVLDGVTEEDFLAFPYGKEAKVGAPAQEGDLSELYSY